jgi:uridine kinase
VSPAASHGPSAAGILALVLDRPPTLGSGRLICFDGPAGSGKTTWATELAHLAVDATLVHMDDLYAGWSGLPEVDAQLDGLLLPLAEDRPGSYRRYDWVAGEYAETVVVEPAPLLVIEGVGSGASRFAPLVTLLAWVEAPEQIRLQRGLARDGDAFAPHWEQWAADEDKVFAHERTRERADVRIDGAQPFPAARHTGFGAND